jgi:Phosphoribosylanthranilate isomerase
VRTRVKICGITRPEDAVAAGALGVDAIGLVFYRKSGRWVDREKARVVIRAVPPFVTVVGLFLDAEPAQIYAVLDTLPIDLLQFHGSESPPACRAFGRPYVKAVPMGSDVDVRAYARDYADAQGLLLDSHFKGASGGSGRMFDWSAVPRGLDKPLILAGGLTPENVAEAIRQTHPYGIDVSSGIESAQGVKDAAKMAALMRGVHSAAYL